MRKIIIAFDGSEFSEGAMTFAKKLNEQERIMLTGLFLPQVAFSSLWSYSDAMTGTTYIPLVEESESALIQENIEKFSTFCSDHGIRHSVNKALFNFALPELQKETRFADLVILGSETFYKSFGNDADDYLKDAIHFAECPVVVVPENYRFPESNILAYDGSESSVFAIKQFIYLFPEFTDNPTTLITINAKASDYSEKKAEIRDLVAAHFSNLSFLNLEIDAKKYLATWMSEKAGAILVCGAFSRSFISQLFRQSFVEQVLREHKLPLFISHR